MSVESTDVDIDKLVIDLCKKGDLMGFVRRILDKNIKRDYPSKLAVFSTGLSAFTEDPLNTFLKGESSIGKTYVACECLKYFPKGHVWILGNLSPKALIHEKGKLITPQGEILDPEFDKPQRSQFENDKFYEEALAKWHQKVKDAYYYINLSRKIILFLEIPEYETFRLLYPILSHDTNRIEYKFTDKTAKGQLKTTKVIVEGFPATIFLSTDRKYVEELATRSLTATPEATDEKIFLALEHLNKRYSYPWLEEEDLEEKILRRLIEMICWRDVKVIIPFPNLHEIFRKKVSRDMRDFKHFLQLIKAIAFLHALQRERIEINGQQFLPATIKDVAAAIDIFSAIIETTRTGTEERILRFYHDVVSKRDEWRTHELVAEYNKSSRRTVSSSTVRKWLDRLMELGYVDVRPDPTDNRVNLYSVLQNSNNQSSELPKDPQILTALAEKGLAAFLSSLPQPSNITEDLKQTLINLNGYQNVISPDLDSHIFLSTISTLNQQKESEIMGFRQNHTISEWGLNQPPNSTKQNEIMGKTQNPIISGSVERKEDLTTQSLKKPMRELIPSIPCPLCSCVFASEEDLQSHLRGWHKKAT